MRSCDHSTICQIGLISGPFQGRISSRELYKRSRMHFGPTNVTVMSGWMPDLLQSPSGTECFQYGLSLIKPGFNVYPDMKLKWWQPVTWKHLIMSSCTDVMQTTWVSNSLVKPHGPDVFFTRLHKECRALLTSSLLQGVSTYVLLLSGC